MVEQLGVEIAELQEVLRRGRHRERAWSGTAGDTFRFQIKILA
jgi:hypothetical protein